MSNPTKMIKDNGAYNPKKLTLKPAQFVKGENRALDPKAAKKHYEEITEDRSEYSKHERERK